LDARRAGRRGVLVAPLQQRREHRGDVTALGRRDVLVGVGALACPGALEQAVLDELREPVAEDVRCDAEAALDLREATAAEQAVAHDEKAPALTDDGERGCDRAVLLAERAVRHDSSLAGVVAFCY